MGAFWAIFFILKIYCIFAQIGILKTWFDVNILRFQKWFDVWTFNLSFGVDILAFFQFRDFLGYFWKNWAIFSSKTFGHSGGKFNRIKNYSSIKLVVFKDHWHVRFCSAFWCPVNLPWLWQLVSEPDFSSLPNWLQESQHNDTKHDEIQHYDIQDKQ